MAANEPSRSHCSPCNFPGVPLPLFYREALQEYRKVRENGEDQDSPKTPFPSAGFENLKIKKA